MGAVARSQRQVAFVREALETPDGDELLLDHVEGAAGSPRLLAFHGLEGSSYSVYVQGFLATAARRGWRGTALNFRSCARDPARLSRMLPNRRPRLYHSGETTDADFVIGTLARREPGAPLFAVGASLGGNVLLKWLGEHPGQTSVAAAVAVSTPYDLAAGSRHLRLPSAALRPRFLRTLKPKALLVAARFPEAAALIDRARRRQPDVSRLRRCRDGPPARIHGRGGLLRAVELSSLPLAHPDAHALSFGRRRSLSSRLRSSPCAGGGVSRRDSRDDAPGRPRRLRLERGSALLGRGGRSTSAVDSQQSTVDRGKS